MWVLFCFGTGIVLYFDFVGSCFCLIILLVVCHWQNPLNLLFLTDLYIVWFLCLNFFLEKHAMISSLYYRGL